MIAAKALLQDCTSVGCLTELFVGVKKLSGSFRNLRASAVKTHPSNLLHLLRIKRNHMRLDLTFFVVPFAHDAGLTFFVYGDDFEEIADHGFDQDAFIYWEMFDEIFAQSEHAHDVAEGDGLTFVVD
jgi:hypothetical protein